MSVAGMLYGIRATVDNDISFTWVDADFLEKHEVQPWAHMTVWVPPVGEFAGFSTSNIDRAIEAGLTFRPLADTVVATMDYWKTLPAEKHESPRAGCPAELEESTLKAWHARESE